MLTCLSTSTALVAAVLYDCLHCRNSLSKFGADYKFSDVLTYLKGEHDLGNITISKFWNSYIFFVYM